MVQSERADRGAADASGAYADTGDDDDNDAGGGGGGGGGGSGGRAATDTVAVGSDESQLLELSDDDASTSHLYVAGGRGAGGTTYRDVWVLSIRANARIVHWLLMSGSLYKANAPSPRYAAAGGWSPAAGALLLVGGCVAADTVPAVAAAAAAASEAAGRQGDAGDAAGGEVGGADDAAAAHSDVLSGPSVGGAAAPAVAGLASAGVDTDHAVVTLFGLPLGKQHLTSSQPPASRVLVVDVRSGEAVAYRAVTRGAAGLFVATGAIAIAYAQGTIPAHVHGVVGSVAYALGLVAAGIHLARRGVIAIAVDGRAAGRGGGGAAADEDDLEADPEAAAATAAAAAAAAASAARDATAARHRHCASGG
ncbi:hypothetical protein I4F81_009980 [Pyropia yezoensis]|uniref:Uncharacterized protein n=1 Tax=Pyropia yezoensis TaxID=2788 RepID=A0ACC3CBL8_PYRYE|nr:hypothetical protein I4F81_009980 [Neopyropia yezoensis]